MKNIPTPPSSISSIIDSLDVDDDARALGITPDEIRNSIREAVAAGLLVVEICGIEVTLRGTVPVLEVRQGDDR